MRRIPNFVLLRAFEAAARLESFSLAAHELHLTPSAISHQVRELEEVFGRALFIRSHRRVELTPEGRRLSDGLSRVLDAMEACCAEVAMAARGQVLALHCAPSFAAKWLGPRLPAFAAAHPDISIRLSTDAQPMDLTMAREVDVTISYGHAVERSGLEVLPLGRERIVPMCAPSLKGKRSWKALVEEATLIDSQLNQVTWRDWFSLNGLQMPPRPHQSFDRAALAISAAADGMGIALETTRLAERELSRGDVVVPGPTVFKPVDRAMHFFSQRTNERHLEKVRRFREWLLAELGVGAGEGATPPGVAP